MNISRWVDTSDHVQHNLPQPPGTSGGNTSLYGTIPPAANTSGGEHLSVWYKTPGANTSGGNTSLFVANNSVGFDTQFILGQGGSFMSGDPFG